MLTVEQFKSRQAWIARAPGLHIEDPEVFTRVKVFRPGNAQAADMAAQFREDGYFRLHHDWGLDLELMARTVRSFSAQNIPPVFVFLFDEFWAPFYALDALYGGLLGAYGMLPNFWVWNVDPKKNEAGWPPHRDLGYAALRPDGSAISLTTWIPLSDATPLNSCMYVVPAHSDPTYGTPQDGDLQFSLPAIRALPAAPGDVLVWNQAVMHWGSRASPRAESSRVSMAFEFQRSDCEPLNTPILPANVPLAFDLRLKLVARQVLQYRQMYRIDPAIEELAQALLA